MKKAAIILVTIILFVVSGCAQHHVDKINYTYQGENALWSAEFKLNATVIWTTKDGYTYHESDCDRTLTVTYKNDILELSSAKEVIIGYDSGISSSRTSGTLDTFARTGNTFTVTNSGGNSAMEIQESVITVTIQIDGNEQTFDLKYVN